MFEGGPSFFQHEAANPQTLTGAFVTILRQHFADPDNTAAPADYTWTDDPKTSSILVEPYYAWSPENIQQRPAVIASRGPWSVSKMGIGGVDQGSPNQDGYVEDTGRAMLTGSSIFYCLGTTGLEAEKIGVAVSQLMICFSTLIRNRLCLSQFYLSGIGEVHKLEECREHFAVPVTVKYDVQWSWDVMRQAPIWARLSFTPPE